MSANEPDTSKINTDISKPDLDLPHLTQMLLFVNKLEIESNSSYKKEKHDFITIYVRNIRNIAHNLKSEFL